MILPNNDSRDEGSSKSKRKYNPKVTKEVGLTELETRVQDDWRQQNIEENRIFFIFDVGISLDIIRV